MGCVAGTSLKRWIVFLPSLSGLVVIALETPNQLLRAIIPIRVWQTGRAASMASVLAVRAVGMQDMLVSKCG